MAIKKYKPTTPSRRWITGLDFSLITKKAPEKSLCYSLKRKAGRNNFGHIVVRHRGGGHKRKIRIIDFRRDKQDIFAQVRAVEYDPNRSCNIALVCYADGEKRYILAPMGLHIGDRIISAEEAEIRPGNCLPIKAIPPGTFIHNIELIKGKGGQIVRAAGTSAQILVFEGKFAHIKLPSGEVRRVLKECRATIGQVGNPEYANISIGKAGRMRWLGKRPTVRGVAMNPVDHPMGGGEGKASGGRPPCNPWGKKAKGLKTRKKNKATNKYIIKDRRKK